MTMGFSTKWKKGKYKGMETKFPSKVLSGIKKHSFRNGHRWKPGHKIHMATGVRTKHYNCFSLQDALYVDSATIEFGGGLMIIKINDITADIVTASEIAINDGFSSYTDFYYWFWLQTNKGTEKFDGQLINWTNLDYGFRKEKTGLKKTA